jgi:transposase InsO family protein
MTSHFCKRATPSARVAGGESQPGAPKLWACHERIAGSASAWGSRAQSSGMAEAFVNTLKRDDVSQMDHSRAKAVLAQLPAAFVPFSEIHPDSVLKVKAPRMFRRELAPQAQVNDAT